MWGSRMLTELFLCQSRETARSFLLGGREVGEMDLGGEDVDIRNLFRNP